MLRHHPNPADHIPISLAICHQLRCASMLSDDQEDWEIAAEAIDEWMRRHRADAIPGPASAGIQWKRLFLPDGTLLRTVFNGKSYHCRVDGDTITYDGKAVSPSGFVNAVGGIRRNAWKCTWLLFPDVKDWKLADSLRSVPRPRKPRNLARPVLHQRAPRPSPSEPLAAAMAAPPAARTDSAPGRVPALPAEGHGRIEALLRHPMLPLLYRICAIEADPPGAFNTA